VIDVDDIRARYGRAVKFLDERGRRLFAANEALASGYGGVTATGAATGLARSTIRRAIVELQGGSNLLGPRVRRPGGRRRRAVALQPGLLAALEALIEDAIRGDPETPLRWVSRSQRQIARALLSRGFQVSQKLVGLLLRELGYSCQANRKTEQWGLWMDGTGSGQGRVRPVDHVTRRGIRPRTTRRMAWSGQAVGR
jgi:hypothetical protein